MTARAIGLILFCCACLLTAVPADAHGTGQHILGTVTAVSDTQLDITTQKGQAMTVRGWTNSRASCQPDHSRESQTHRRRSIG